MIDDQSDPGSWRDAIRDARIPTTDHLCRACGASDCNHPDAVFCGVVPEPQRVWSNHYHDDSNSQGGR